MIHKDCKKFGFKKFVLFSVVLLHIFMNSIFSVEAYSAVRFTDRAKMLKMIVRAMINSAQSMLPSLNSITKTTTDPTIVSANQFNEDFSSFSPKYYDDGKSFGEWLVQFAGYGLVGIESESSGKFLRLSPKAVASAEATSSSLVTGPKYSGPIEFEAKLLTLEQLRTGSTPNPWEVAWIIWNYTDNEHFYYFIPKPNGWELGKRDPNYPGGQRFLATGTDVIFPIGHIYDVKIEQDLSSVITVWVNGAKITTFTDSETPYNSGNIGFYTEDALIQVDDVSVKY